MKNFMLYAGPPRTASTWLYGALNGRGDCDFSYIKEHFLCLDFTLNPEFDKTTFFEHYEELASNPDVKLLGEMSTTNCFMTLDELRWFKSETAKKNFTVLPVITLRDPINQILSSTKLAMKIDAIRRQGSIEMIHEITTGKKPMPEVNLTVESIIRHLNDIPFKERKVSWKTTYDNMHEVFDKVHVNFYETLFTNESMNKLCEYLQIPTNEFDFSKIVHKMGDNISLSDNDKSRIYQASDSMLDNYQFAVETFGKDFIESIWWTPNK